MWHFSINCYSCGWYKMEHCFAKCNSIENLWLIWKALIRWCMRVILIPITTTHTAGQLTGCIDLVLILTNVTDSSVNKANFCWHTLWFSAWDVFDLTFSSITLIHQKLLFNSRTCVFIFDKTNTSFLKMECLNVLDPLCNDSEKLLEDLRNCLNNRFMYWLNNNYCWLSGML